MFENLLKTLQGLDGTKISVRDAATPDADGYCDRQCPATECRFFFKVQEDDWKNTVRDEAVWCPFCGYDAPSEAWWTVEQIEKAKEAAFAEVKHRVNSAVRRDAERFNRRQPQRSFFSMSMRVDAKLKEIVLPTSAMDVMQLKIVCAECACRYAVIGSAYFCPACGHNAADLVFGQSLGTIRATLDSLPAIVKGLQDRDVAENTVRLLTEDSLQRMVTAFQRFAEALYVKCPGRRRYVAMLSRTWRKVVDIGRARSATVMMLTSRRQSWPYSGVASSSGICLRIVKVLSILTTSRRHVIRTTGKVSGSLFESGPFVSIWLSSRSWALVLPRTQRHHPEAARGIMLHV